jgi:hypothetical protein
MKTIQLPDGERPLLAFGREFPPPTSEEPLLIL